MDDGGQLLLRVAPLALGAAVSPAFVGASLGILSGFGARGIRLLLGYLAGAALVVAAALALASDPVVHARRGAGAIVDAVDLVLAGLLVAIAVVTIVRHPRPDPRPNPLLSSRGAGPAAFGLGVAMMATNVSTLVLVLAGGRDIGAADAAPGYAALASAMLAIGALLPVLVPLVWRLVSPEQAERGLQALGRVFQRHGMVITVTMCLATALYLTLRAVGVL